MLDIHEGRQQFFPSLATTKPIQIPKSTKPQILIGHDSISGGVVKYETDIEFKSCQTLSFQDHERYCKIILIRKWEYSNSSPVCW